MEFELWSSIIQVFLKSDSMEIFKSAQENLCQFDGRICRFSSSKLICGSLQPELRNFLFIVLTPKYPNLPHPGSVSQRWNFQCLKMVYNGITLKFSFFFCEDKCNVCDTDTTLSKRIVLWGDTHTHAPLSMLDKSLLWERCLFEGIFLHEAKSIWDNWKTSVGNLWNGRWKRKWETRGRLGKQYKEALSILKSLFDIDVAICEAPR